MKKIDTLIFPHWLIPIEPHNVFYTDYAVALNQGKILDLLPKTSALEKYEATETIKLDQHVLLPGLVNSHTHSPMTLFRGLADDLPLMTWLTEYIWPKENQWLSEEFVYDGTLLALAEMLRSGTTSFHEHYLFPISIAAAVKAAKMRASIGMFIISAPTAYCKSIDDYFDQGMAFYQHYKNDALIKSHLAPHAPYTMDDAALLRVKALAKELNLSIHMHVHESVAEIEKSLQDFDKRPLKRLAELGLFEQQFNAVHMVELTEEDFALLQEFRNINVIHCPDSNLKLGNGICKVQNLIEQKTNVALGTDSAASNNDLDMFSEMHIAALLAKSLNHDPTALPAASALRMATLNGARILGLEKEIGSIEIGKAGDLIAVDLENFSTTPVYNPISHLVYAVNSQQVTDVWVAGERLLKNKSFTTLDKDKILAKAKEWSEKISR